MSDLTPLNQIPIPSEYEESYYATMKGNFLANDMATWALSENDNLIWSGGGVFSWDATTGTLIWSAPVEVRAKTTAYKTIIQGPPLPGGQLHLNDGECAFFQLPRLLVGDQILPSPLTVGPLTLLPGVRLHDIKMFACRVGTTIFLPNGKSIKDGESGGIFGAGIGTTITPHEHQPPKIIEPLVTGQVLFDLNIASFAPSLLQRVQFYRNGQLLIEPVDYTIDYSTGFITLTPGTGTTRPNTLDPTPERFVALMQTFPPVITTGQHQHLAARIIEPPASTSQLDVLVTSLDYPALSAVTLFRGGALLSEPADYTLNLPTGTVTLTTNSIAGERFVALREVAY